MRRLAVLALSLASLALAPVASAQTASAVNVTDGVALHGFDPVAYFTQHKPVKGSPQFTATYQGATYEFASKEDQAAFQADPAKYAPQYGGYCAYGVAGGHKADIDPHAFTIKNGKLYVNYSEQVGTKFRSELTANISKAEHNWSAVSQQTQVIH